MFIIMLIKKGGAMKKLIMIMLLVMSSSLAMADEFSRVFSKIFVERFKDERFDQIIAPLSKDTDILILTPTQISYHDDPVIWYRDCELLKNQIGVLFYKCGPIYDTEERKEKYKDSISYLRYEIVPSRYSRCEYLVRETDMDREDSPSGSTAYFCIEKQGEAQ